MTLERARGMISQYLEAQAPLLAKRRFVEELRRPRHVAIYLEPPRLPIRQSSRNPALGSSGASVDIVEFSDFQCPFCKQAAPTLRRLVEKYEGRVRLVWKDFPLPTHAAAKTAAEAGACAHDQGRFWDFHDLMFANRMDDFLFVEVPSARI